MQPRDGHHHGPVGEPPCAQGEAHHLDEVVVGDGGIVPAEPVTERLGRLDALRPGVLRLEPAEPSGLDAVDDGGQRALAVLVLEDEQRRPLLHRVPQRTVVVLRPLLIASW